MARPMNHDKRINDLLAQLRRALVAREQARIEATVEAQMAGLVGGLGKGGAAVVAAPAAAAPSTSAPAPRKRKGWSAAAKAKAKARMKAYWAAKRGKAGKAKKPAATSTGETAKT